MFDTPVRRRGRGSQSNGSGRFETFKRIDIDDGWRPVEFLGASSASLAEQQQAQEEFEPENCYQESAAAQKTQWREDRAKTVITENQSPDVHFDRSVNPYRGCEHGCAYCFARPTHAWLGHSAGLDFERLLYAKLNAAYLLEREFARPGYRCKPIAVGVNTDAYQPLERKLGITRQILEVFLATKHPLYLITKSALIERDIDLLSQLSDLGLVTVSISLTSLDNELSHRLEPRAAAPHRRLRIIQRLAAAGIPVRASVSPIIPALNEHELDAIVQAAANAGATAANAIVLRLPHELAQLFPEWLDAHYPLKKARVLKAIRSLRGGKLNNSDFNSRFVGEGPRAELLRQRFELACRRAGLDTGRQVFTVDTTQFIAPQQIEVDQVDSAQMSLF